MATPKLGMTTLVEGQTNSEATVNTAIQDLDVLLPLRIEDNDIPAPPGSPTNGHAYYIAAGTSPSGDWSGKAGKIAVYNSGWRFFDPVGGMTAFIHDEGELVYWHSQASEWVPVHPRWSTSEHFTGRYGEGGVAAVGKIYAKCFEGLSCPNNTTVTHSHSISNLALTKHLNFEASITDGTTVSEMNLHNGSNLIIVTVDTDTINITSTANYSGYTADIRLEYQKTS